MSHIILGSHNTKLAELLAKALLRVTERNRWLGCLFLSFILLFPVFIAVGIGGAVILTTTPLRRALPASAQDIHEWSQDEGGELAQDYAYLLKAKITRDEFYKYVNKIDLTLHTSSRQYSCGFYPSWSSSKALDWWAPSEDLQDTYVREADCSWTYAKYEDGYIYVVSFNI